MAKLPKSKEAFDQMHGALFNSEIENEQIADIRKKIESLTETAAQLPPGARSYLNETIRIDSEIIKLLEQRKANKEAMKKDFFETMNRRLGG